MSTMVEILQRIIETRGAGCEVGLCRELRVADDWSDDLVDSIFETWEHFSGSHAYPVPNPSAPGDEDEAEAIFDSFIAGEGFLGEYGELRLKLAQHLLEALQERFGV